MRQCTTTLSLMAHRHEMKVIRRQMQASIERSEAKYGVRAVGSWATGEMHLPQQSDGWIQSLSDIDFVSVDAIGAGELRAIHEEIDCTARSLRLTFKGVSVRTLLDLSGSPHECSWNPSALRQILAAGPRRLMLFWTAIAGIEAAITAVRSSGSKIGELARSYAAVKFFFTAARNRALVTGDVLGSYIAVCTWLRRNYKSIPILEIYAVKTGAQLYLSDIAIERLFGEPTMRWMFADAAEGIEIAQDVRRYCADSVQLRPQEYARLALLGGAEVDRRIVEYELRKLGVASEK